MIPVESVATLRKQLDSGQFSSVELTKDCLKRLHDSAQQLNCMVTIDDEGALQSAADADREIASGQSAPLLGIPIVHKDLFCTEGLRTSCASRMLDSFIAPYDATVVANIRDAGAVCLGKTNMDEFAMGSSNETSYYGAVANPWDTSRVPGGSSGGSAAAVAARLSPLATGSDTGGSIRQPAAFCGISGLKPTYGRVSRFGMVAFASSLDQGGPMAQNVEDVGALLSVMEGHDRRDSTSATSPPTDLHRKPDGLVVGMASDLLKDLDKPIQLAMDEARRVIESNGHTIKEIALPHADVGVAVYYVISSAEASTNLARYDGVRYGHRADAPADLNDLYCRSRSEGFGTEVKRRILTGTYALSIGYYDAYYNKAQCIRRLVRQDFLDAFESVDVLIAPATPTPAFPRGGLDRDPIAMYRQDRFTTPISLAGLPSLSVPCGFVDNLPIGMQLIGRHFEEAPVLALGREFQRGTDWHLRAPDSNHA